MATKLHSQVVEGSRHAIHNLTYANAANRIAGTGEGSGINPPTTANLWQIAKQDDDNSLWLCVDTAPLTWVQIVTSASGGNTDDTYNNFGANPAIITVDAAEGQTGDALTFALNGVNNLAVDLTSSDNPLGGEGGTYYGLYVNNGTDNFKVVRAGANLVDVRATLNDFIVSCSDDFNLTAPNFTQTLGTDIASGNFIDFTSTGSSGLSASAGTQNWVDMFVRVEQSGTASYNALRINLTQASVGSGETNLMKLIVGGSTQFQVASNGNTRIGTGAPSYATGVGDLFVDSDIEADSIFSTAGIKLATNQVVEHTSQNGTLPSILLANGTQSPTTGQLLTGSNANSWIICEYADRNFNFAHSGQTRPTLFIHSENQSTSEWISMAYGRIVTGAGNLQLLPQSGVIEYPDAGQTLYDISPASNQTATGDTVSATVDTNATGFAAALYQASDGNWDEADADAIATMPCRALALETGTGTKLLLRRGWIRNDTWAWTPGAPVYVSTTTGGLTQTIPSGTGDQVQIVGYAETADILDFNPSMTIVEVA
jgi:hypothetical protein